jgi:hypothetical protein
MHGRSLQAIDIRQLLSLFVGWTEPEIKEMCFGQIPSDLPGFRRAKKLTNKGKNLAPVLVFGYWALTKSQIGTTLSRSFCNV